VFGFAHRRRSRGRRTPFRRGQWPVCTFRSGGEARGCSTGRSQRGGDSPEAPPPPTERKCSSGSGGRSRAETKTPQKIHQSFIPSDRQKTNLNFSTFKVNLNRTLSCRSLRTQNYLLLPIKLIFILYLLLSNPNLNFCSVIEY